MKRANSGIIRAARILLVQLVLAGLLILAVPVFSETPAPVVFPDSGLENAIRNAIDKPEGDIYPADLAGLTALNASGLEISSLESLQYCFALENLDLSVNRIDDITPLASLSSLVSLKLGDNAITDLAALSGLNNLSQLDLGYNRINDITALSSLVSLQDLSLNNNHITDISPLSALTNLFFLALGDNQISDVSALTSLEELMYLYLSNNQITDISSLTSPTKLVSLGLDSNGISDITALTGLTGLDILTLQDNKITDISALVANTGLGEGDYICLIHNDLDVSIGSANMNDLTTLAGRGVVIDFQPQNGIPKAALEFDVELQGSRSDEAWNVPLTVKLFTHNDGNPVDVLKSTPVYELSLTTVESSGKAAAQAAGIVPGKYDISLVSPHCLMIVKRGIEVTAPSVTIDMGVLPEGNANGDNRISIQDFGLLAASYGKAEGEDGFDPRADFDRNGRVNIADFGLLAANYGRIAPVENP